MSADTSQQVQDDFQGRRFPRSFAPVEIAREKEAISAEKVLHLSNRQARSEDILLSISIMDDCRELRQDPGSLPGPLLSHLHAVSENSLFHQASSPQTPQGAAERVAVVPQKAELLEAIRSNLLEWEERSIG